MKLMFGKPVTIGSMALILLGIWFCYLAFTFVRHLAWWLMWHVGEVAALLASVGIVWVCRKLGNSGNKDGDD